MSQSQPKKSARIAKKAAGSTPSAQAQEAQLDAILAASAVTPAPSVAAPRQPQQQPTAAVPAPLQATPIAHAHATQEHQQQVDSTSVSLTLEEWQRLYNMPALTAPAPTRQPELAAQLAEVMQAISQQTVASTTRLERMMSSVIATQRNSELTALTSTRRDSAEHHMSIMVMLNEHHE